MKNYIPKRNGFFTLLILCFAINLGAQTDFVGTISPDYSAEALDEQFTDYEVFQLNVAPLKAQLLSEASIHRVKMSIGALNWDMEIYENNLRGPDYKLLANTEQGVVEMPATPVNTYMGHLRSGGTLRMTITNDMILGYVRDGGEVYNMEPLRNFVKNASPDEFVLYTDKSVKPLPDGFCGTEEEPSHVFEMRKKAEDYVVAEATQMMECRELELAIAHDLFMYQDKGSEAACEGHAESIMNLVQGDYEDQFFYNIQFIIVTQFVETASNTWPTGSNDAGQVLQSFRNWGNGGNFGVNYDLAQLWTNRDFSGGTVGIAYLSAVCNFARYHALQDYTGNFNQLRCMTSHEIGHNFSCQHDAPGSNTIMAPSVSGSSIWSNQSKNQLNNFASGVSCLNICFLGEPPIAHFTANPQSGCAPMTVQFTDQSTGTPETWNWSFPGGTPSSSTQQNPTVVYNTPGVYDVTLIVTNQLGTDVANEFGYIEVKDFPLAGFLYTEDEKTIHFNSTSQYADLFIWDFGDGYSMQGNLGQNVPGNMHGGRTTGTYDNPSHTYDNDGTYPVLLTVIGDCGSHTYSDVIEVISPVSADFAAIEPEGCASHIVEFIDQSTPNVTTWEWEFPGGSPASSTDPNPVVTYTAAGVYDVILNVGNAQYTDRRTKRMFVRVDDVPVADFGAEVDALTVEFSDSSKWASSYKWYFGDGDSSTQRNPVHSYPLDTIYEVTLISTNDCGSDTMVTLLTVGSLPEAVINMDNNEGCPSLDVQFYGDQSERGTRYFWSFPGGNPLESTEPNPLVSYDNPGTYDVTLIVENGLGRDTLVMADAVTVEDTPTADFDFQRNDYTVNFNNMSSFAHSYLWDFGDGNTSNEENPEHTYGGDGNYTVRLGAINDCDTNFIELTISVSTAPSAAFRASATAGCVPFEVRFENRSSNNANRYEWTFEGGSPASSTDENPVVSYNTAGTFSVTLIAFNGSGSDTIVEDMLILADAAPSADFNVLVSGATAVFTNRSNNEPAQYNWNFGDGNSSTEREPSHEYAANGMYQVTLIASNECGADTIVKTVNINVTNVVTQLGAERFALYPNPNNGQFFVVLTGVQSQTVQYELIDVLGRPVYQQLIYSSNGDASTELFTGAHPAGTYFFRITAGDRSAVERVVIHY